MEREARETRERASNASKARAERAARTARAGATRQGTEARREWREPPEDRNSKPVRSPTPLLGRFAAYAGGLRWESVSVTSFLCRPCVKPMKIYRKSSKNDVRRIQNRHPEPLGASRAFLGLVLALLELIFGLLGLTLGLLGRSWGSPGAPGSLWGASWGLQNGSRRPSRRPPAQELDFRTAEKRLLITLYFGTGLKIGKV